MLLDTPGQGLQPLQNSTLHSFHGVNLCAWIVEASPVSSDLGSYVGPALVRAWMGEP